MSGPNGQSLDGWRANTQTSVTFALQLAPPRFNPLRKKAGCLSVSRLSSFNPFPPPENTPVPLSGVDCSLLAKNFFSVGAVKIALGGHNFRPPLARAREPGRGNRFEFPHREMISSHLDERMLMWIYKHLLKVLPASIFLCPNDCMKFILPRGRLENSLAGRGAEGFWVKRFGFCLTRGVTGLFNVLAFPLPSAVKPWDRGRRVRGA